MPRPAKLHRCSKHQRRTPSPPDIEINRNRPIPDGFLQQWPVIVSRIGSLRLRHLLPRLRKPRNVLVARPRRFLTRGFARQLRHTGIDIAAIRMDRLNRFLVPNRAHALLSLLPNKTAPTATNAIPSAPAAIEVHASLTFFVGTTGSGGRLYTSGLSTNRKNAFNPSVPG